MMKKPAVAFLLGFAFASGLFLVLVLPLYGREKVEFGRQQGEMLTKLELMKEIPGALGEDYKGSDGYRTFFTLKADAVVVVERNGVKTLRNYVAGR
jgi:hypothetical protein